MIVILMPEKIIISRNIEVTSQLTFKEKSVTSNNNNLASKK